MTLKRNHYQLTFLAVYVEDGLFPKTTEWDWNEWVKHYAQGNTENLTIEAVSHYLK
ncbi:hypothetical protein IAF28_20045, partial [Acinetobacter baumannii]|nr:hypothetical protein [Acinetobacter baumannii]